MKSSYGEAFIAADERFLDMISTTANLDPLGMQSSDVVETFQAMDGQPPVRAANEVTEVLRDWQGRRLGSCPPAEIRAARRDFDKVIGSFVARKANITSLVPNTMDAFDAFIDTGLSSPRADFYDYSFAAPVPENTYTGDDREVNLLRVFRDSSYAAHQALYAVLRARDCMLAEDKEDAVPHLADALGSTKEMQTQMASVYRAVGPAFVANEVTRYLTAMSHNGDLYEGPNPSHSGFMVLDRFLYGSWDNMLADKPALRKQYDYRRFDIPTHLNALLESANLDADSLGIVGLARQYQPEAVDAATEVAVSVRKFKVAHKSYADKGLAAKGKTLDPEEPDLLTDNIILAREREK